jgi:hypothetical protein
MKQRQRSSFNGWAGLWPAAAVLLVLVWAATALGQSTAVLQGTVTDASGASVPGAEVVVQNQATRVVWKTETNSSGNYLLAGLPPGVYRIEVKRAGFQTHVESDVKLDVGTIVVRNVSLQVGSVSQQVVVSGGAPVIETGTITVGQVVDQNTVQNIPLNGRHFVDLGLLIPGSVTPPANGFLTFPLRGQGSFGLNTAGQREDMVNFMINGINLNDQVQNQITFQPSINTVAEFKVDNSTFSAEYGRNAGAIVNIATRSGTNDFHGEVFEYHRNNAMDARNFFNPTGVPQAQFIRNQFGASGGGPLIRDRAFFFLSYEGLRQRQGVTINTLVLTDAERAQAQSVNNPTVAKLLPLIPRANSGANRFIGSASAPVNIDQGTADILVHLSARDHLHGYYAYQNDRRIEPTLQGDNIPGFGDTREGHRQVLTLNETHSFTPALINEARLGFNRIFITFTPNFLANPQDFSINNGITMPIGLPFISIRSIGLNLGGPAGFPQGRGDTTAVFSDTLRWLHGNHTLSVGGEVRRFYNNNFAFNIGTFSFADVTHFINGQADRFTVTLGNGASRILLPAWGIFVADSYRLRPNLMAELGLRYDWNSAPTEARDRFVVFDPATGSLVQTARPYDSSNRNVQPRVGLVWNPWGDQKTVVRAAYAILTDQPVSNAVTGLTTNPPFNTPVVFNGALTFQNALTVALAGNAAGLAPSTINREFTNPYVQSYNLNIQRELTPTLGLMVGYFGSKGTHLRIARNLNQPSQLPNGTLVRPFPTVSATSPIRPGAALGNITEVDSSANSNYNGLWVTLNKRMSRGLQFSASYTWSKSIDYNSLNSQGVIVQDSNNIRNDRGLSDFDVRHRFVLSGLYSLPFRGHRLIEGWQISSILQAQSGNPLTVIVPVSSFTGNFTLRPDLVGTVHILGDPARWFTNTVCNPTLGPCPAGSVFALPEQLSGSALLFHFGNLGRNTITGPDFVNMDFSLLKDTRINERWTAQFRADIFDLFNHPNFGNPGLQAGTSTFGQIFSTRFPTGDFGSSRQIQLALKLIF